MIGTEQITYTQPFKPLSLPEAIELNFADLGLLEIISEETGLEYEQLIHIAIKHLYLNRHTIFNEYAT